MVVPVALLVAMIQDTGSDGDDHLLLLGYVASSTSYTKIYSTAYAFAALKTDGSIAVWRDSNDGGSGAPGGSDYRFR